MDQANTDANSPSEFSRRSTLRAAVWSLPVVAVATSAPAAAASVEPTTVDVALSNYALSRGIGEISSVLPAGESFTAQFAVTNHGAASVPEGSLTVTLDAPVQFFGDGAPVILDGTGWSVIRAGEQVVATYAPALADDSVSSLLILEFTRPNVGDAHVDGSGAVTYLPVTARAELVGPVDTDPSNNEQTRSALFPFTAEVDLHRLSSVPTLPGLQGPVAPLQRFSMELRVVNQGPATTPWRSIRVHILAPVVYFGAAPASLFIQGAAGYVSNGGPQNWASWTHYRSGEEYVVSFNGDLASGATRSFWIEFIRPNNGSQGLEGSHGLGAARIELDGVVGRLGVVGGSVGQLPIRFTDS